MTTALQSRRGTTAQHGSFTGLDGEVTVDTSKKTLVVHDGSTAGGNPLPTLTGAETLTNKTLTAPDINGGTWNGVIDGNVTSTGNPSLNLGTGALTAGNATLGDGTALATLAVNGTASGTGGGAFVAVKNGGVNDIVMGNKSSILGGAYDSTATIYSAGPIDIYGAATKVGTWSSTGLSVSGGVSATGNLTVSDRTYASYAVHVRGANTTAAASQLTVDQLSTTTSRILSWGPDNATAGILQFGNLSANASVGNGQAMTLDASNNLLVGTTAGAWYSSVSRVRIDGPIAAEFKATNGAASYVAALWNNAASGDNSFLYFGTDTSVTMRGTIDYNRAGGLVRYNTTSDGTLKNIIGDADLSKSVALLSATRIREYSWKDDATNKAQIGVIAQEVHAAGFEGAVSVGGDYEETVPAVTEQQLVTPAVLDDEGNEVTPAVYETIIVTPEHTVTKYRPWGVDKTAWTFHLVAGFQHLQAENAALKAQLSAIESRLAALESA